MGAEGAELAAKALDKYRQLYPKSDFPDGHHNLATGLNDLAVLLEACGQYGKAEALYREAQLVLRAAVGTKTLDALLGDKESVGNEVRDALIGRAEQLGVSVKSVRLRDMPHGTRCAISRASPCSSHARSSPQ